MVTEKIINRIIGGDDDQIEDTLKKQFSIKEDKESEDCMGRKRKWK